jgi:MFS family permease
LLYCIPEKLTWRRGCSYPWQEDRVSEAKTPNAELKGLPAMFRALESKNYRLFFIGQGISLIGTWMQSIAMSWLVYRLTGSALLLGVTGFASQFPVFLLASLAGVYVDRHNRHKILLLTQVLSMCQAFVLAALVFTNTVTVWSVIVLSVFLGLINALDMPARQTFVLEMVEKRENLSNAIALNSSMVNSARLIGPSIGGILIAVLGEGACFTFNGVSFLAVIFCLLAMRLTPPIIEAKETHVLRELKEGFSYAFGFAPIRYLILLLALVSLLGMSHSVLMPVFAAEILKGGANTLGFLASASGTGALMGTLYLASRRSMRGLGRIVGVSAGIFGVGLVFFSLSRILPLSLVLNMATGCTMIVQLAGSNTILQSIVDDDKRGRVMSIYAMSFMGMAPFGSLLAGALASGIGAPTTVLLGGLCCIAASVFVTIKLRGLKDELRAAYGEKHLIPEP